MHHIEVASKTNTEEEHSEMIIDHASAGSLSEHLEDMPIAQVEEIKKLKMK